MSSKASIIVKSTANTASLFGIPYNFSNSILKIKPENYITLTLTIPAVTYKNVLAEIFSETTVDNYETLINCTDDLLWSLDPDFKLIAANNAFVNDLYNLVSVRFKPGDFLLQKNIFTPDLLAYWKRCYKKALAGKSFKEEIHFPKFNQREESWTDTSFKPIYKNDIIVGVACHSRNTTDKKKIEVNIKVVNERLRAAQKVAKIGSWETNLKTLEVVWSDETFKIFEIDQSACTLTHPQFIEFVHPDDRGEVETAFIKSLSNNNINTIEHRIITGNGCEKIVEEHWQIFCDAAGNPQLATGTCQDITERKKSQIKLHDSEFRYGSLIEQAHDAIFIADSTQNIIDINPSSCKLLGYNKEEFLKLTIGDLFNAEDLISNPFKLNELFSGKVASSERRFKRKDGTILSGEINARILNDGRFVVFARDITERKKTEEALKASFDEKNTILESIDDGFFAIDNNSLVTYWNRKAEILLGEKRETVIGRNLQEIFARPDADIFSNNCQKAIREQSTVRFEGFSHRTNKWFAVSAFASASGLSVHFKDVTERKQFEEKIKESELRYRSVIEQATDTICIADSSLKFIEINPAGCRLLGYSRHETLQLYLPDLLFNEDLEINPFKFNELKEGEGITNECRIKRKDGSAVDVELSTKMLEDGRIIMFGRDISERKLEAQKLIESNRLYNLISNATNDMVWDWDLVTDTVYRNSEGWKKIFRTKDNKNLVGLTYDWDERIHPDDKDKVSQIIEQIKNPEKDFFEVECRVLRDDGSYAYVHDRAHIIRNAKGKAERLIGATQDITQRKEAEFQVLKSEIQFRSLVQNSSDLTGILDDKGYFLYSSPTVKRILGYDGEYMTEKNAFTFVHPDDISMVKNHLQKIHTEPEDKLSFISFRFKNSSGEWRWLESKVTDMSNNAEIRGYIFNARDVTERKIAEAEIEKLSLIARETTNAVIITDAAGKIVWVNEAFTTITEFKGYEVTGKKPGDFLQGEQTNLAVVRIMRNKLKKMIPFECDLINYSKTGKKYWIRIQCQPLFDDQGKLKNFFAVQTDITKEKEAEEILKKSEERYRYLFNNNPASILIWDIETLKLLEVNDTAVRLYGYSQKEFLTKNLLNLRTEDKHNEIIKFAQTARECPGLKKVGIWKHINKAGEEMFMEITSHRIEYKGKPVMLALGNNITKKVLLENELDTERLLKQQEITQAVISAQELERQELGSELHDNINQILAGSRLYLGLATKELKIKHAYLTEADSLINTAIIEIRNLSHSLIPPSLNDSELLGAIANIVKITQQTADVIITVQALGFDESCLADNLKLAIYRIIQEQFNNILKHAHAKQITLKLFQHGEKTVLSIKDNGIGFNTKEKAKGVGLINIKTRVSLFNGELAIISSPGKGCEIRVVFK